MLLQRLCDYADRELDLGAAGYERRPVRYVIDLDRDGRPLGPPFGIDTASEREKRGREMLVPNAKRSGSKPIPLLLADTAWRTFELPLPEKSDGWISERHADYAALVRACGEDTGAPELAAVAAYLEALPGLKERHAAELPEDGPALVTWRVDGVFPVDLPAVRAYWANRDAGSARDRSSAAPAAGLACLLCGSADVARIHPVKIKGIPGGQATKDLISANEDVYESYGLENSAIAPVCGACAEKYAKALNALLSNETTRLITRHGAHVFWTSEGDAGWFLSSLSADMPEQVHEALRAARTGRSGALALEATAFFALGLGASGSRVVVSSWLDTTVASVVTHLERYFALQQVADPGEPGGLSRPAPLWRLTGATVRDPKKETPPPTVEQGLLALALAGRPLPLAAVFAAVRRCRAEQGVTLPLAMLIKMGLGSQPGVTREEQDAMTALDETSRDPAYVCGRLLSILDAIQRRAIDPNATLVDRFYGAASATPATVFGPLLRNAQNHLGKLRKTNEPVYRALDSRLTQTADLLDGFPATLDLKGQARFALGFYHQKAADRQAAIDHRAAKDAASAAATGDDE